MTELCYDGRVFCLRTKEWLNYSLSLHPKQAVIAAYAQDKKDFNTWDYDKHYGHLVKESNLCYLIGDFSAFKEVAE